MKNIKKTILMGGLLMLVGCKSISPEAQAVIDQITSAEQNTEHTYTEYSDIKASYEALTEESKEQVSNYTEYEEKMNAYFDQKKEELDSFFNGREFYYTEKDEPSVSVMRFNGDTITFSIYEFDGNGKHEAASTDYEYQCDGKTIYLNSSSPMSIQYSVNDLGAELEDKFLTQEQIIDGLQGDWTLRTTIFGKGNEWNMSISGNDVEYENAAEAYGYSDGSYYYYGPYSGSITIEDGSVSINSDHGEEFFFSCYNGNIKLYHYGNEMSPGNGLKGEDGYYDAF